MAKQNKFATGYKPHPRVQSHPEGPSLAKQSFGDECNINKIMSRYEKDGLVEHINQYQGQYADLPSGQDYQYALNAVIAAKDAFQSLPAKIRTKFDNNPELFLAFVDNPDNKAEMIALGLGPQPEPIQDDKAPQASPEPSEEPDKKAADAA